MKEMENKPNPGITCPQCGYKMRVYRTRTLTGTVSRERICDRCGHREDTEERIIK
jgi:transcriptional regulator NrdR family protein